MTPAALSTGYEAGLAGSIVRPAAVKAGMKDLTRAQVQEPQNLSPAAAWRNRGRVVQHRVRAGPVRDGWGVGGDEAQGEGGPGVGKGGIAREEWRLSSRLRTCGRGRLAAVWPEAAGAERGWLKAEERKRGRRWQAGAGFGAALCHVMGPEAATGAGGYWKEIGSCDWSCLLPRHPAAAPSCAPACTCAARRRQPPPGGEAHTGFLRAIIHVQLRRRPAAWAAHACAARVPSGMRCPCLETVCLAAGPAAARIPSLTAGSRDRGKVQLRGSRGDGAVLGGREAQGRHEREGHDGAHFWLFRGVELGVVRKSHVCGFQRWRVDPWAGIWGAVRLGKAGGRRSAEASRQAVPQPPTLIAARAGRLRLMLTQECSTSAPWSAFERPRTPVSRAHAWGARTAATCGAGSPELARGVWCAAHVAL